MKYTRIHIQRAKDLNGSRHPLFYLENRNRNLQCALAYKVKGRFPLVCFVSAICCSLVPREMNRAKTARHGDVGLPSMVCNLTLDLDKHNYPVRKEGLIIILLVASTYIPCNKKVVNFAMDVESYLVVEGTTYLGLCEY